MRSLHSAFLASALGLAITTNATNTLAQDYPNRPIRLVTMYAAGSGSDASARFMAQQLSEQLKQPVVVENKGGAGGLIGTQDVVRSKPDGYSLLYAAPGLVSNLFAYKNPQYKWEDFTPLGVVGMTYFAMIIHNSVPAKNVKEFIAYAKANPTRLNYGSLGPAGVATILSERLKRAAGIQMEMIPFKGGDPVAHALMAGDVQVYFAALSVARIRLKSPQIVGLAVTGDKRSKILPDLPTFAEAGFPQVSGLTFWDAVFAQSTVPAPVVQKLRGTLAQIMASPEMKERQTNLEREAWTGTLNQFVAFAKGEGDLLQNDFKLLKIQPLD